MKKFALACAALALAACEPLPPEKGPLVPYKTVLAENKGKPFECSEYDPVSETCSSIARITQRGNSINLVGYIAFPVEPGKIVTTEFTGKGRIVNGRACGVPGSYKVSVIGNEDPTFVEIFEGIMEVVFENLGSYCANYHRVTNGEGYITEILTPEGQPIPESRSVSRFFATQPKLRPIEDLR